MSGWGFLSKAEGFLDRVLDEQSKEKSNARKSTIPPSAEVKSDSTINSVAPIARWQDRLTKAASQFNSTESLQSLVSLRKSLDTDQEKITETQTVNVQTAEKAQHDNQPSPGYLKPAPNVVANHDEEFLTEWQRSSIFPPNMPHKLSEYNPQTFFIDTEVPDLGSNLVASRSISSVLTSARPSGDSTRIELPDMHGVSPAEVELATREDLQQIILRLNQDLEACEQRRINEAHVSSERISSLESRLSYFTNERLSETRQITSVNGGTPNEKIIAEKDEKIALLLSEGESLSKKEMQHLANLKKLRSRVSDLEGLIATSLKAVEKADDESTTMRRETKTLQETLKRQELRIKELSRLEQEVADHKRDKLSSNKLVADLKRQLADADDTISQNVSIWTQLQQEKSKTDSLQKQMGDLLREAKTTADEHASDLAELQGKLERLTERSRNLEDEKRSESARLEAELENLRATLEEATTGAGENSQTKLLRQLESLQTQQALARQNWARIEESLVLRSSHAEKERDELREQEQQLRDKVRQASLLRKEIEEERGASVSKCKIMESTVRDLEDQMRTMDRKLQELQDNHNSERALWYNEKETILADVESQVKERLVEERRLLTPSMPQSPFLQDHAGRSGFSFQRHITESPNSRTPESKRPMVSRSSTQASRMPQSRRRASNHSVLDELKSPTLKEEDFFLANDSATGLKAPTEASISTVSGGVSVGMMERVTANARKLELEMGILREDLARITKQRDEARSECVELEGVVTDRKLLQRQLTETQTASEKLQTKFNATLELLGEQTEENEQLREDIQDMKKAFRETLESIGT